MNIVQPSFKIMTPINRNAILKLIERAARTCYKSEGKAKRGTAGPFVEKICKTFKHESVIEHAGFTVKFICDRGVTHELVRHRLAAYSQESTRYCNYAGKKFGGKITVVDLASGFKYDLTNPVDAAKYAVWVEAMKDAERHYLTMLRLGASPQEARSVLPNSLKTEIVMTANMREWQHVFKLRASDKAHPQIRQMIEPLRDHMIKVLPEIFAPVPVKIEEASKIINQLEAAKLPNEEGK